MTNKPATCEICGSTLRPTATYCAQCGTLVAAARFIRSLAYETVRSERGEDQDTGEPFRYIVVRAVWRGKPIRATKRYPTATSSPLGYLYPEHVGAILDALAAVALARYTATGWKLGTGPVPLADEPFITARERIGRHVDQETAKVTITGIELQLWHPIPPTSTQDGLSDGLQERDERRGAAVARWVRRMRNGFPSEKTFHKVPFTVTADNDGKAVTVFAAPSKTSSRRGRVPGGSTIDCTGWELGDAKWDPTGPNGGQWDRRWYLCDRGWVPSARVQGNAPGSTP